MRICRKITIQIVKGKGMSQFTNLFSDVVSFYPEGYYVKKDTISKDEALELFKEYAQADIEISEIKESYVRFQPTPRELREDIGDMAWIVCSKNDRNAQACWCYGE